MTMTKRLLLIALLLLVPALASAQVPFPTPPTVKIGWDHDGVNTDGYALFVDGTRTVIVATCTGTGAARTCDTPFPAMTPGVHVLKVAAFNAAGEAESAPLTVTVFVKPGDPGNVRIIIGG
jgi:hypothetical protein